MDRELHAVPLVFKHLGQIISPQSRFDLVLPSYFSGGFGQSLSEGERTGCAGVAESQVFGDIAVG